MELSGRVCVVTGAGGGIGRALAMRFAEEGAAGVVVVDLGATADAVADEIGERAVAVQGDVSEAATHAAAVAAAEARWGPVDLYCSNAGIGGGGTIDEPDELWNHVWEVNVLAHVKAARVVLPSMLERGHGYLLNTASAAGLLTQIGNAPYSATKHAAVGLAEWLAITYGDRGIRVSVLCPQGVRTDMLRQAAQGDRALEPLLVVGALEPEQVAATTVEGLRDERFWILPHPEVADYARRKANDVDRWLAGMRPLQSRIGERHDR
jgi:NAD(P)-dependent dehydrogenase (short-subunit alcohol dehydrogenase family)